MTKPASVVWTLAAHEFRSAVRSRVLGLLILSMVLVSAGSITIAAYDYQAQLADYQAYIDAQDRVSALWRDPQAWTRQSILNSARMGKLSSDRTILDYCGRVWKVQPTKR